MDIRWPSLRLENKEPKLYTLPHPQREREREREEEEKGKKYLLKGKFNPKRKISLLGFYLDQLTVLSHDETRGTTSKRSPSS